MDGQGDVLVGPDVPALCKHICNSTRLLIDCGASDPLDQKCVEKTEMIRKFATDVGCRALMVEKNIQGTDIDEEADITWSISTDVRYGSARATGEKIKSFWKISIFTSGVIFIKTGNTIETDKSIPGQLQSIVLREDSLYESLHLYLSCAVSPFFKSYLRESSKVADSRDFSGDKMGPSVEKKLVELEMGLLHLQQNVDIPEISLTPHPTISHIIRSCNEQGS